MAAKLAFAFLLGINIPLSWIICLRYCMCSESYLVMLWIWPILSAAFTIIAVIQWFVSFWD